MKIKFTYIALAVAGMAAFTSCKKDKTTPTEPEEQVQPYTVPATYTFTGADYSKATARVKMGAELNSYLGTANNASITATKANDMFDNKNSQFADATLNTSGVTLAEKTSNADFFRGHFTTQATNSMSNNVAAVNGAAGVVISGTTKRLVGATGLESNQAVAKGMMGALYFKEVVKLLSNIGNDDNKAVTNNTTLAQRNWDDAFGLLGIPADYDPDKTYTSADANRPLLWGGYLAERGKEILAGKTIFEAFRKGRAALGGKDKVVVAEQAKIILDKWEQLNAAAALEYATIPTRSVNVGNLATQFHALSEGFGFVYSLQFRQTGSKLSAADYAKLKATFDTNFYTLINEANFTKLVEAQTILKTTYGL
ncbi:DUF4856 domain-containing protein [Mucilaginibacter conchicola]|uniref:DUF4856 domain-containing protein n=1 Tax=Mucilaginibacter conchicola TaxID=2303333 RepID=A0A372NMZ3_9SPHI|nr:DUF4856 domain-containing protein [Mucilaginibacter conchicola]RFZ89967.1 DUF4856 domain-containing protein [Mucilaginibacter conchicola]